MNETSKTEWTGSGQTTAEKAPEPVLEEAKDALARATTQARERVGTQLEAKKEKAAEAIGEIAKDPDLGGRR